MKNVDLINKLKEYPEDMEICVLDFLTNLENDWGDGSSVGLYKDFEVELFDDGYVFVGLSFENINNIDDFDEI